MKIPITKEGLIRLKKEREELLGKRRPEILKAIEEARAHGDLSENAEYDAAKEEYQLLVKKIAELDEMIEKCVIVEHKGSCEKVGFGCTVKLKNLETDEVVYYTIVGPYESDVKAGRISITSPLGKALVGKEVGDEVKFVAPSGEKTYEILEIV